MKIIQIEQHSEEWHKMRCNYIGASMAPIIMGASPWKTPYRLWQEMLHIVEPPTMTEVMQYGIDMEPIAREAFNDFSCGNYEPCVVMNEKYPWLMASLDGWDADFEEALEIKCPGEKDHQLALNGKIPEKYYWQLQQQMLLTDTKRMNYWSYRNGKGAHVIVHANAEDQKRLIKETYTFWLHLKDFTEPPKTDKDIELELINSPDLFELYRHYSYLKSSIDHFTKDLEETKQKIIADRDIGFQTDFMRVTRIESKGRVQYEKIPELAGINLDNYRSESKTHWRIDLKED